MTSKVSAYETTRKRPITEISTASDPLHVVGYKVYQSAIVISDVVRQEVIKKSSGARAIFNYNERTGNDNKRRQSTLTTSKCNKVMREFIQSLNEFIHENISSTHTLAPWVVLHSRPGCQDQAAHCDYVPDPLLARVSDEQMPLGVIVALMPGTRLNAWPNSIRLAALDQRFVQQVPPIRCKEVELQPGDILVFRGDFVHAGSSYQVENYRLHTFLDSKAVPRKSNRTWIVHAHGGFVIREVIVPK